MAETKLEIEQRVDQTEFSILRLVSILADKNILSPEEVKRIETTLRGETLRKEDDDNTLRT